MLKYQLEQGRTEQKILELARRNNMPIPDSILDAPEMFAGDELYLTGYLELNTCRSIGMAEGPIPWTAIREYCFVHDITGELLEDFMYVIKFVDVELRNYQAEKQKQESDKPKGRRPPAKVGR